MTKLMLPLFKHQETMAQFGLAHSHVLNTSDAGTAKTRGTLEGYRRRRATMGAGRMLVSAPLSILKSAWGDDITAFTECKYAIAHGGDAKRRAAFESDAEIVLINHDGVKWLVKNMDLLEGFTDLVIDEFTAYKNRTSDRSKAMLKVSLHFEHITELSGTPDPNTVLDIWHPVYILDHGKRLGTRFFQYRNQVCMPEQIGPSPDHIKWVDKPGAAETVADALADITIRFKLEDCIDLPENRVRYMYVDMPSKVIAAYKQMMCEAVLITTEGKVSAINAGVRVKKLLQILSGALYDEHGKVHPVHNDRYELVLQLVKERAHSIVAFNWQHEREALSKLAGNIGIAYGILDGSVNATTRAQTVELFQAGRLQTLFCHPQSAAHGLTLTRGTAAIWCTPTYNAEHFQQFNRRIYRAGQNRKTETICIAARGTKEVEVYERLNTKVDRMETLLTLFASQTKEAA